MSNKIIFAVLIIVSTCLQAGGPSNEHILSSLKNELKSDAEISDFKISVRESNNSKVDPIIKSRFKAIATLKDLYKSNVYVEHKRMSPPLVYILNKIENKKFPIYGITSSSLKFGEWSTHILKLELKPDIVNLLNGAYPLSYYSVYVIEGTKEHDALIKKYKAYKYADRLAKKAKMDARSKERYRKDKIAKKAAEKMRLVKEQEAKRYADEKKKSAAEMARIRSEMEKIAADRDKKAKSKAAKKTYIAKKKAAEKRRITKQNYIGENLKRIRKNWKGSENAGKTPKCEVEILQGPGNIIMDVVFVKCLASTNYRLSIENAIYKSEPLLQPSDASFDSRLKLVFWPDI